MKTDVLGIAVVDDFHDGVHEALSNFYICEVFFRGITFKTSEHAFVWCKATTDEDRQYIIEAPTPGIAKRRGKEIVCRPDFKDIQVTEMLEVIQAKFSQHADLSAFLIGTGDSLLIEGNNWHDNFWGNCTCGRKPECSKIGDNFLGKILMQVRGELRDTQS